LGPTSKGEGEGGEGKERGKEWEERGRGGEGEKTGKEGITMGFSLPKVNPVTSLVAGNHTPRYCSMFKAYARNSV